MHLIHCAFSLGGLIAPVIAKNFIAEYKINETSSIESSNAGCDLREEIIRLSSDRLNELFFVLTVILSVVMMTMAFEWGFFNRNIFLTEQSNKEKEKEKTQLEMDFEKVLAGLLFVFFCFYVGCEMVYTNFIFSFGICHLELERGDATALTTIFWLFFTIFRGLSAIQAQYMSAKRMLWTSIIGSFISSIG